MKRNLMVFVFIMVFAAANCFAETKIITGYNPGEFAVKGQVEQELKKFTESLREALQKAGDQLQFSVVGSADATGKSVINDQLGKLRAEQVGAYLSANFPGAKVNIWSSGDDANVRQVRVEFTILHTPAPAQKNENEKNISENIRYLIGAIILVAIIAIVVKIKRRKKTKISQSEKTEKKYRWVEAQLSDGKFVSVKVEVNNNLFVAPLLISGKLVERDSYQLVKKAVRGWMKNPDIIQLEQAVKMEKVYFDSIENLLKQGIIKDSEKSQN